MIASLERQRRVLQLRKVHALLLTARSASRHAWCRHVHLQVFMLSSDSVLDHETLARCVPPVHSHCSTLEGDLRHCLKSLEAQ